MKIDIGLGYTFGNLGEKLSEEKEDAGLFTSGHGRRVSAVKALVKTNATPVS